MRNFFRYFWKNSRILLIITIVITIPCLFALEDSWLFLVCLGTVNVFNLLGDLYKYHQS